MADLNSIPIGSISYSDIDMSMNVNPITGDVLKKTGAAAVVQSVINLIQMGHYEYPFHPEIGSGVSDLLFELATPTTCQLIAKEIRITLDNFEPRVQVLDVVVEVSQVGSVAGFNVTIRFLIVSIPQPVTISVFLERVR